MKIIRRKGWELRDSCATDEGLFLNRRALIAGGAALGAALPLGGLSAQTARTADPSARFYPARRNDRFALDRPLTPEETSTRYNNFYEFGSHKQIWHEARKLVTRPWTVRIDGLVAKPRTIGIDDLIAQFPLEERLYRLRCVEAWAMAVPWTGFPLAALIKSVEPMGNAKYVRFETFHDAKMASGQRQSWYPWPYVEAITMAEAMNDLTLMVTGAYGKPLPNQMGAPLRLALPWKYGFKSIKSITRISFTETRPKSFWEQTAPREYGFWANVNPEVPHPRWSQASEEMIGTGERRPTQIYNGYGEFVASLYTGINGEKLFM